jgi:chromosome segregation ATPase
MISRKIVCSIATLLLFVGSASLGRAQASAPQSDSLGDAARKARAAKKEQSSPPRVFTNEDVPGLKGTISVVGSAPSDSSKAADAAPDDASKTAKADDKNGKAGASGAKDEAGWRMEFAAARKALAEDSRELDLLQRELSLKQEQYYQDPSVAMKQQNSREDVDKAQSDIAAKKQDVEKDKQTLADLQDALRKAGGNAGWAEESANSGSSGSGNSDSGKAGGGASTSGASSAANNAPL